MKRWDYLYLWGMAFLVLLSVAIFQHAPGYMDAEYYYATALRIVMGEGLTEPFLWNYLGDGGALPQPSHGYWMPLASFLAMVGLGLAGGGGFSAARTGFLLVGASIPPLAAALAHSLTKNRKISLMAGIWAGFSTFYLPFLPTTDTFGIYMLCGGAFFLLLAYQEHKFAPLGLGLVAGLMHLSRADGILWLAVALFSLAIKDQTPIGAASPARAATPKNQSSIGAASPDRADTPTEGLPLRTKITPYLYLLLGYLLIFAPWMVRNLLVFGSPLGDGGFKTLWLTTYDELYAYPAGQLTFARWWGRGLKAILQDRIWALGLNVQTALVVQGQIVLFPLLLWGMWKLRRDGRAILGGLAWLATLGVMTVIFPFAGARGGFFHSGAALQPLFWALSAVGFHELVAWGAKRRGWRADQARRILEIGITLLLAGASVFIVRTRVLGLNLSSQAWNATYNQAQKLEQILQSLGAKDGDIVMVNNPPGYSLVSERPSVVIPNGDVETLVAAAQEYRARYLILEKNHPQPLDTLYGAPRSSGELDYLQSQDGTHFFRIEE